MQWLSKCYWVEKVECSQWVPHSDSQLLPCHRADRIDVSTKLPCLLWRLKDCIDAERTQQFITISQHKYSLVFFPSWGTFFRLPESQSWSQNSQRLFSKGLELTIAQQLPHVLSRSIIHRGPLALRLHHVGLDHSRFCCRPATGPEFGGIWCWERTFLIEVGVGESEWIEWRMGWTTWVDFR